MSETLPSHQNELQPWQRELVPHGEVAGTLNPNETLALMGSWAERDLVDQYEIYEPGTKELARQEAVYGAALGQLAELRAEKGDSMNDAMDALYIRQQELKDALRRSDNQADNIKIGEQLAGIKLLDDIRLRVTDQVGLSAEVIGSKSSPRDKATAINEMIAEHNEWVSRGSETIADSPEMQEAQARINARYAEQAKQPQPTETVDDARKKVAEAFGDTGEKDQQALIGEVAQAAKGKTRIYTDIPKGVMLKSNSGDHRPIDGFNSFGDGLAPNSNQYRNEMLNNPDSVEAVVIKETDEGVRVSYQFDTNSPQYSLDAYDGKVPFYTTESGRPGNVLYVEATLPTDLANKLREEISKNPIAAREFAKTLARNNGITDEVWDKGVRPPYDKLPDNWQIAITSS